MDSSSQDGPYRRMPTVFGPMPGPRQPPPGRRFDWSRSPLRTSYAVSFLAPEAQLTALLPPGFRLAGEPVVTVEATYLSELEWLAGRGYAMLGVRFPAIFEGQVDRAEGAFLAVLWENLADPIISGREELGFAKLWCDIPEPRVLDGSIVVEAGWLGHRFLTLRIDDVQDASAPPASAGDGLLHWRMMPATGRWGGAAIEEATLTPAAGSQLRVLSRQSGQGSVTFHRSRWEDLPTLHHIVDALADLEQVETRGATLVQARGGKDLSDQRVLR